MTAIAFNPAAIAPAWNTFQSTLPIKMVAIQNEAENERVVAFMSALSDVVGDDEAHQLVGLLDWVGQLVEDFESTHLVMDDAAPYEVLRFLF